MQSVKQFCQKWFQAVGGLNKIQIIFYSKILLHSMKWK